MAHPFDATALQINVVRPLGKHWAFDIDNATEAFGNRTHTDGSRVLAGWAVIIGISSEGQVVGMWQDLRGPRFVSAK
jgi:hypothetical protein